MVNEQTMTQGRAEKHAFFKSLTPNVYFQAPTNVVMRYPAIRYDINSEARKFADNQPYNHRWRFQVIVIDNDPDSHIRDEIAKMALCTFERKYIADDLHHFVFNLF